MESIKLMLIMFLVCICCGCSSGSGELTLINTTNFMVKTVEVKISHQVFSFINIRPNEKVTMKYKISGDSSYEIIAELSNGKIIVGKDGYVMRSVDYKHVLEISNENVSITHIQMFDKSGNIIFNEKRPESGWSKAEMH